MYQQTLHEKALQSFIRYLEAQMNYSEMSLSIKWPKGYSQNDKIYIARTISKLYNLVATIQKEYIVMDWSNQ